MSFALRELISGNAFTIYGLEENAGCPVVEFFSEVERDDRNALDSMLALLERMANHGPGHNKQKFRDVGDGVYEFKAKHLRVCWFYDANRMVICANGFTKGAKKLQSRAILEAKKDKNAYFAAKKLGQIPVRRDE